MLLTIYPQVDHLSLVHHVLILIVETLERLLNLLLLLLRSRGVILDIRVIVVVRVFSL